MPDAPRYRAEVTGHFVQFFSRDTKIATVRWHSRFKAEYRTLKDARAAKEKYDATGKILWPEDLRVSDSQRKVATRRSGNQQQELRI